MTLLAARIAIVGVGLIGGSLGMAIRKRGLSQTVVGVGRNADTLERAIALGAIDTFTQDFATGILGADVVILATPIPQILNDLARLAPLIGPDTLITDVGSIKSLIVETGEAHLGGQFVGSHPMAGSEKAGVEAARPDLFVGATWVVTPTQRSLVSGVERLRALATGVGANCLTLDPDAHDRAVAVTSHLPHVLAYAMAAVAGNRAVTEPQLYDVAAGSFASVTRVAGSNPELWQGICLGNRSALMEVLLAYRAEFDSILSALSNDDGENLLELFSRGYQAKIRSQDHNSLP